MLKNKISGLFLIAIGITIPIYNNYYIAKKTKDNNEQVTVYLNKTMNRIPENITKEEEKIEQNKGNNYIAVLEIPKIKLKRGLVNIDSKYNDIKYNIAIIKGSSMPDTVGSNLVLAAHNGSSNVSFFKNLDKLGINTEIYLYYKGYKYIYSLEDIKTVAKKGIITITRDTSRNTISLITCKTDSDTEQVIYLAYLIDKEAY